MVLKVRRGFTLVEFLVTIGIALVLASGIFAAYERFNQNQRLRQAGATLKNNLRFAQAKAVNGEKPAAGCTQLVGYTVTFTSGSYSIQATCTEGAVGPVTSVSLPTNVTFSASPSPILFRVLTGAVAGDTTLTITDGTRSASVQVKQSGDINEI